MEIGHEVDWLILFCVARLGVVVGDLFDMMRDQEATNWNHAYLE